MTENNTQELDRKDLKIMAYKEKVSELEEANADLRVEITFLVQQLNETTAKLGELEAAQGSEVPEDVPSEED